MKQTAVEWYYEQTVIQGKTNYSELLKQAKNMEKHQIETAWQFGQWDGWSKRENDYNPNYYKASTGEDYYNWEFKYVYGQLKNK